VSSTVLRFASLSVELIEQRVFLHDREIELQPMQFRILAYLVTHRERDVSSRELVDRLFRTTQQKGSSNVRSQILKLRRRLGADGVRIVTTPSGWRLARPIRRQQRPRDCETSFTSTSVAIR
jgi:two-component system, OmpR family, response regulator